jgi:hypothetical protein
MMKTFYAALLMAVLMVAGLHALCGGNEGNPLADGSGMGNGVRVAEGDGKGNGLLIAEDGDGKGNGLQLAEGGGDGRAG